MLLYYTIVKRNYNCN